MCPVNQHTSSLEQWADCMSGACPNTDLNVRKGKQNYRCVCVFFSRVFDVLALHAAARLLRDARLQLRPWTVYWPDGYQRFAVWLGIWLDFSSHGSQLFQSHLCAVRNNNNNNNHHHNNHNKVYIIIIQQFIRRRNMSESLQGSLALVVLN